MTHPHKDLIIALLDDPTLEVEMFDSYAGNWLHLRWCTSELIAYAVNHPDRQVRLREKPKPDVVTECRILGPYKPTLWNSVTDTVDRANLRLTFSADGVLKSAEVLGNE